MLREHWRHQFTMFSTVLVALPQPISSEKMPPWAFSMVLVTIGL